jgi:hypothetical protein
MAIIVCSDREISRFNSLKTTRRNKNMLYPMFAMVILTVIVAFRMLVLRVKAVKSGQVKASQFRLNTGDVPSQLAQIANNYSNLFEMPVLFYAASILAIVMNHQTIVMISIAWLFVLSRVIHSWIHITSNHVLHRLKAFLFGVFCILIMWILLFIHQLSS